MASALPITNQLGKQQQLPAGDNLLVRGGIDVDAAGALTVGPTTATSVTIGGAASAVAAVTIGKSGVDTTILGNLVVNENFSANVSAVSGVIDLGDGSNDIISVGGGTGDTVLMKGLIGNGGFPNLSFGNGQDHAIDVAVSAAETVGRALSVGSGAGGASVGVAIGGAGGALSLLGSAGGAGSGVFAGGAGSPVSVLGGTGGASAGAALGGVGGASTMASGTGGAGSATGVSGAGGGMTLAAGSAGANGGAGQGLGGSVTIDAGSGATKGNITIGGTNVAAMFSGNVTDNPSWKHKGTLDVATSLAGIALTTNSPSKVNTTANYAEAIRMNSTGTGAEVASILVGDANPNGDVLDGSAGSIFLDGLAGKAYLKTDDMSAWVEMATGMVSLQAAYDGGISIVQSLAQGSMTVDRGTNTAGSPMLSMTDSTASGQSALKITKSGTLGGEGIAVVIGATNTGDGVNVKTNGGAGKAYSGTIAAADKAWYFDGGGTDSAIDLGPVLGTNWGISTAVGLSQASASGIGLFTGAGGASAGGANAGGGGNIGLFAGPGGAGSGTFAAGSAGDVFAQAGDGGAAGTAAATASAGGVVSLTGGVGGASAVNADTAATGGALSFAAGAGGVATGTTSSGGDGGAVTITAGAGGVGTSSNGGGGAVTITAGAGGGFNGPGILSLNGGGGGGANGGGGSVFINPGAPTGAGTIGEVNISAIGGQGGTINIGNIADYPAVFHKGSYNLEYAANGTAVDITSSAGGSVMIMRTGSGAANLRFEMATTGLITLNNNEAAAATNSAQQLVLASAGANIADVSLYTVDANPDTVVSATRGSLALADTGVAYINTDGATAWSPLAAGSTALQQAYAAGSSIVEDNTQQAVTIDRGTNTTNAVLAVTDTAAVAQAAVTINKSPSVVTAGSALSVTTGANASGDTLFVNGGAQSSALHVQSQGNDVILVDFNGNYTVTSGIANVSILADAKTPTAGGSFVSGTSSSGSSGNAGSATYGSVAVNANAGDVTVRSAVTGTGIAGNLYLLSDPGGSGVGGGVAIAAGPAVVPADKNVELTATADIKLSGTGGGVAIASGTAASPVAGNVELTATADITLQPGGIAAALPVNGGTSTNNTSLDASFAASSIVGCLNELKTGATSADTTVPSVCNGTTAITVGQLLAIDNDGGGSRAFQADANGVTTRPNAIGFAKAGAALGAAVDVIVAGETTIPDSQWDAVPVVADSGKRVYMSTTAGKVTLTAPAASGDTVLRVGIVSFADANANTTRVIVQIGEPTVL